jgi:hypothetical protein
MKTAKITSIIERTQSRRETPARSRGGVAVLAFIIAASAFAPRNRAQFTTISTVPAYGADGPYEANGSAVPNTPSSTNSGTSFSTTTTASALGGFPNTGSIIGGPLPVVGSTFSVPNFTPAAPETNAMVGVPFQPGSRSFIMAVAGLNPNGTPAGPSAAPNRTASRVLMQEQPPGPVVVYRRAAAGSASLITRETETESIESFPAGAILRRGAAPVIVSRPVSASAVPLTAAPRAEVAIPEVIPPSAAPVVTHDFPPGAFVRR